MDIERLITDLTPEEKVALVAGTDFMFTNPVPRLGIPSVSMADGPHGLRKQKNADGLGVTRSEPATSFPTAVTTASSWDPENTRKMGAAIAEECRHYGVHVLLGPGVNLKRNPRCGRNFEYFSEDPLLTGAMGAAEVQGVQSQGVGVSVKHFALNNNENYRFMGDSIADQRTMRELYLRPFQRIVQEARPATLMCAYNKINGTFCSENDWILTDVLRKEWGYEGLVMTDWGATHDRVAGVKAGLDLEMPGDTSVCRKWLLDALQDGTLSMAELDQAVRNVLRLVDAYVQDASNAPVDWEAHHALAAEIAEDSAVLLKNDGVLPLTGEENLLVVGDLFAQMRYQGAGSSMINPTFVTSPKDAFDARGIQYAYAQGYSRRETTPDQALVAQAVQAAADCDTILAFVGLTDDAETEGGDRPDLSLPENQLALIDALTATGKPVILVLFGGSVVELPFAEKVQAMLHMFLPGQNGGTAVVRLLYGDVSPSGRLSESWPLSYDDVPFGGDYANSFQELYREGIYMGYRYYQTAGQPVRYPFGYGLSYTTFAWSDMQLQARDGKVEVSCNVTNTGSRVGAEVVQLYVSAPKTQVFKPDQELRAFQKVRLQPGETERVTLTVPLEDLRFYWEQEHRWVLEGGTYDFRLCSDSQTLLLHQTAELPGEMLTAPYPAAVLAAYGDAAPEKKTRKAFEALLGREIAPQPEKYPVTLESRFSDFQQTRLGRLLYRAVMLIPRRLMRQAEKLPQGPDRDNQVKMAQFMARMMESDCLRSMAMSFASAMSYNLAEGMVEIANGHVWRGLRRVCAPVKAPRLPKETTAKKG